MAPHFLAPHSDVVSDADFFPVWVQFYSAIMGAPLFVLRMLVSKPALA